MRRRTASILAILLSLSLVFSGCGNQNKKTDGPADTSNAPGANAVSGDSGNQSTASPSGNSSGPGGTAVTPSGPSSGEVQKDKPPEIEGVVTPPADGIGKAGVDYKELATGPADDWGSAKVPYFNPLGSMKLYDNKKPGYTNDGSLYLEVLDQYYTDTFTVKGEVWDMGITNPDFKIYWLRAYAKSIGATMYNTPGDTAVFQVYENERSQYWVRADISDKGCRLRVVRTDISPAGQETRINPADFSTNSYSFYTDSVPGKLQSVTVTLNGPASSGIRLSCEGDRSYGVYERLIRKDIGSADQINTKKTNRFVFDDIPITDGQLKWTVSWDPYRGSVKPQDITFMIDNVADIQTVKMGEPLGMLRVVGVPTGQVEILPGDGAENRHPESNGSYLVGTRDKDGNTVFSLPSGYYSVRFGSMNSMGQHKGAPMSVNAPGVMRLVPVNSGEITTVTIPREVRLSYDMLQKQYGTFESAGNIDILDNIDNSDTAKVSIVINDPLERDVFPEKSDITITENGLKATVTDIQREPAPADIVLVLDSSGSMKNNMQFAIDSAKKFVERLPDNTNIRLIQFEQKITPYKGATKAEVLASLDKIKAGGGTAMYDAVDQALKLLQGTKKPYVVLFSDGADSRELKNQGKGSTLARDQIVKKITASGLTVLTIGFGESHDPQALVAMSNASKNGAYYAALDPAALDQAFAAVSGKFGNQFTITYERPTAVQDRNSDVPVVSFMIDRSGSMDMDPSQSKDDVGYRINTVKNLFHDFVMNLPAGTLMQLGSFRIPATNPDNIHYDQITTDRKAPVLQGLGSFTADGGTPIISALTTAYSYLSTIPSSKKTLVYFTDAALAGKTESEKLQLEEILVKMKQDGFRILFAGLGNDKFAAAYQDAFSRAAQLSGGEFVISSNIEDIRKKLDELMNRINQPASGNKTLDFAISLNCVADDGSRMDYGAQKQLENFAERTKSGEVIKPEMVKIATGEKFKTYDRDASMTLYGSDKPNVDSAVLEYIPYASAADSTSPGSFTGENQEMSLKVLDAWYMNPFKGIDLRSSQKQFLALKVELSLKAGAPIQEYQIPSIFRHFYVGLNNVMSPASQATWLAETPISEPGDPSVSVKGQDKKTGIMVFMVDRKGGQRVDQLSLHLYDTNYGHINIPLVGSLPPNATEITALPKAAPASLSDTFNLSVDGMTDVTELSGTAIPQDKGANADKNTAFRVVEGQFESKMQALLNIDPTQRFLYAVDTDQGPLVVKMNDIVYNMPLGFTGSTMLAPGAAAPVRMPFQIPQKLSGSTSYLFADLKTGSVQLPVTTAQPYKTGGLGKKWSHEYFDFTVNALRPASKGSNRIVLDFTITDKKDGMGLKDIAGLLDLAKVSAAGSGDTLSQDSAAYFGNNLAVGRNGLGNLNGKPTSANVAPVSKDSDQLLYGATGDWAVLDGATRRGILLFDLPKGADISKWELNCGVIENMHQSIESANYEQPSLLSQKMTVKRDTTLETKLREEVTAAVAKYRSSRTTANSYATMGLSSEENAGKPSVTPAITVYGRQVMEKVASEDDFLKVMYQLSCVPNGEATSILYSPEAVITQGWGTELDLANLAVKMLSRLGYQPRLVTANLTAKGVENAKRITGLELPNKMMPAVAWIDGKGNEKAFVIPFMRDISELSGLAYMANSNVYYHETQSLKNRLIIKAHAEIVKPEGGAAQVEAFNSLNSMFGGEGGGSNGPAYEDVTLFDQEVSLTDMSLDSADISFAPVGVSADGQHEIITALVDTKQGILFNDKLFIDTSFYKVLSVTATIEGGYMKLSHTTYLNEGQKLSNIFQTFAFNLPGLTPAAANTLQEAVTAKATEGKDAGDYATVQWIGHATANRFVRGLTDFEAENQPLFGVRTARIDGYPLAVMITTVSDGQKAEATIDIMQHEGRMLGNPPKASKDGYGSSLGLYSSILEAYALGEDKAVGFMQVWTQLPKDTPIFAITTDQMKTFADGFEKNGAPAKLVEHLRAQAKANTKAVFMVPKVPATINGKQRWAWLEMTEDARNGTHLISVSETGEHPASLEYIILNAASFGVKPLSAEGAAGFLVGVVCIDWGIATYSMNTENYAAILAQTFMLTTQIGEILAIFEGATDLGSKIVGMDPADPKSVLDALEGIMNAAPSTLNPDIGKLQEVGKTIVRAPTVDDTKWRDQKKSDFAGSVKGYSFSEGFQAAVKAYFNKMIAPKAK